MISAFGIDHVSKGVPKGLAAVAGKYKAVTADSKALKYANSRMTAHKQGRLAQIPSSYVREPARSKGYSARLQSRRVLA